MFARFIPDSSYLFPTESILQQRGACLIAVRDPKPVVGVGLLGTEVARESRLLRRFHRVRA